MADWSQLPKELLQLISEKLNSGLYHTRFRSVCSTWRFSIPKPYNLFPFKLPHFSDSVIHQLDKHVIFLIKPPTTPDQQTPHLPWLVRIGLTSTGKFNLWHPLLLHRLIDCEGLVLDFNQLSISDLGHMFYIHNQNRLCTYYGDSAYPSHLIVATCQGEQPLDIVTHHGNSTELVIFHCGDHRWTKIPNVVKSQGNICIFKGRPCVIDKIGRTLMIGSDLSVDLVAEPVFGGDVDGHVYIMVENESELLLVHKYLEHYDYDANYYRKDELVRIDVFRLDQKEKKWLKLENFGDRVLFLGKAYSFTASASDLGFDNGNFVIYCNDNDNLSGDCELSVFLMDQRRTFELSDYRDYIKLFWPPPDWIFSRCHQ